MPRPLFNPVLARALEENDPRGFATFMRILEIERTEGEKEIYENSLLEFVRRAWREIESSELSINWHHEKICEYLEAIVNEEIRDLIINVPPRHTKSLLVNVFLPAWIWCRSEKSFLSGSQVSFLCVSYGATLAETIALKMQRLVSGEWYQSLWGDRVKMRMDQMSRANFGNEAGGERISASVEAGLLGRGACLQILDDVHNLEGAESDIQRDATIRAISEGLPTRVTDPRRSARILIMQRLHTCLLPGTLVRTPTGETPIEAIQEGDIVFGSSGWQAVVAVGRRSYSGSAYGVRLYGHPTTCWTTDNHWYKTERGWVRADDLTKSDWVMFCPNANQAGAIPWEPVQRAPAPRRPTGSYNGNGGPRISREELHSLVESGATNSAIARDLQIHRNTIQCYMWRYGLNRIRDRNPIFGEAHLVDPNFWRLIGYWLAEGDFLTGRGVKCGLRFTFNLSEVGYANDILETMRAHGIETNINPCPHSLSVMINCSQLARWCLKHFGHGAHNKSLPEFIFRLPAECKASLIDGWLRGDGCARFDKRRNGAAEASGCSVSRALIHGFQRLALGLGKRVYMTAAPGRPTISEIRGIPLFGSGKGAELRFCRPSSSAIRRQKTRIESDGTMWCRVKSIVTREYEGAVYDITTPSHDFVVGNATVHNSDATAWCLEHWRKDLVHLMYPARFDPTRACDSDPRSEAGQLLWPEMWTEEALNQMQAELSEYAKAGQFQQMPVPRGGGIIKREWWKEWPELDPVTGMFPQGSVVNNRIQLPAFEYIVAAVDTALTTKEQNDPSAMSVWGLFRDMGKGRIERRADGTYERVADGVGFPKVMLIYGWEKRVYMHGPPEEFPSGITKEEWNSPAFRRQRQESWGLVQWVTDTAKRYKIDYLIIEAQAAGIQLEQEIRTLLEAPDWGLEVKAVREDKFNRLRAVEHLFSNGQVYKPTYEDGTHPSWADPIVDQICLFPRTKHDDYVDTTSAALSHMRSIGLFQRREEWQGDEDALLQFDRNKPMSLPYDV